MEPRIDFKPVKGRSGPRSGRPPGTRRHRRRGRAADPRSQSVGRCGRRLQSGIRGRGRAFLATKITFINEIADLSEKVGANLQEVARGNGLDNCVGSKFLHAAGFRRLLLPEGHPRAGQDRARSRRAVAHRRSGAGRQASGGSRVKSTACGSSLNHNRAVDRAPPRIR